MFDIAQLDSRTLSEKGVPMQVLHPRTGSPILDTEGKPVTITLIGPNSKKSKDVFRLAQQRRSDLQSKNIVLDDEYFDTERFNTLVELTTGWSFDTMDGQPFPFSPDNVRKLWAEDRWRWLSSYAFGFVQQDGNYLPSS